MLHCFLVCKALGPSEHREQRGAKCVLLGKLVNCYATSLIFFFFVSDVSSYWKREDHGGTYQGEKRRNFMYSRLVFN